MWPGGFPVDEQIASIAMTEAQVGCLALRQSKAASLRTRNMRKNVEC
jgi:hypothetical protein